MGAVLQQQAEGQGVDEVGRLRCWGSTRQGWARGWSEIASANVSRCQLQLLQRTPAQDKQSSQPRPCLISKFS